MQLCIQIVHRDVNMTETSVEKTEWASVRVPKETLQEVARTIRKVYGYASVAEYVRDAVREKLKLDRYRIMEKEDEEK